MMNLQLLVVLLFCFLVSDAFRLNTFPRQSSISNQQAARYRSCSLSMNVIEDAFRFFTNLDKEASAKHILMTGANAPERLALLKSELESATDLSAAFSELASKVSECPSASRGGTLGTFKPGMMVKEFDQVCFEKEVGIVHGPVKTQFGYHLILITRRYQGKGKPEEKILLAGNASSTINSSNTVGQVDSIGSSSGINV